MDRMKKFQPVVKPMVLTTNTEMCTPNLLVFSSFTKYCNFTSVVAVSTTKCKPLVINLCVFKLDPVTLQNNQEFSINEDTDLVMQLTYATDNITVFHLKTKRKMMKTSGLFCTSVFDYKKLEFRVKKRTKI